MSQNRLPGSTRGGASAQPTPANNSGGGSGWGDEGYPKGGGLGTANQTSSDDGVPVRTTHHYPLLGKQC